jgi:hypothetical protein
LQSGLGLSEDAYQPVKFLLPLKHKTTKILTNPPFQQLVIFSVLVLLWQFFNLPNTLNLQTAPFNNG